MSKTLLVRLEAEEDLNQAYRWYESQRKGLGGDFLLCVEGGLARIFSLSKMSIDCLY
jgi:toxin ParE1/3/4